MGPWKKFESTVVRLKRSYENTGSVVCLTTEGRQLKQRIFEELTHKKKRYLAVISHSTRFKEINRKKNSNKNIE
jgi:DNA-binding MarR family transcriptional regulator